MSILFTLQEGASGLDIEYGGMGGFVIDILEKSQSLGSLGLLFFGVIAIFGRGRVNNLTIIELAIIIIRLVQEYD